MELSSLQGPRYNEEVARYHAVTSVDFDMLLMACRDRNTHWKQTVFYLNDILTICKGEQLTGEVQP